MSFLLRVIALICFILAALGVEAPIGLVATGLAFWAASTLVDGRLPNG